MTFASLVQALINLLSHTILPLFVALAFLFYIIGIVRYFFIGQTEDSRSKGKKFIIAGIIGFVVLFGVWGIVSIMVSTLFQGIGGS